MYSVLKGKLIILNGLVTNHNESSVFKLESLP